MGAPATKRLSPRDRLQSASDFVLAELGAKRSPAEVIDGLVDKHGAKHRASGSTNTLRAAGVTATCTWSRDTGLLDAWRRLATLKLLKLSGRSE